jgi:hypothetical protein
MRYRLCGSLDLRHKIWVLGLPRILLMPQSMPPADGTLPLPSLHQAINLSAVFSLPPPLLPPQFLLALCCLNQCRTCNNISWSLPLRLSVPLCTRDLKSVLGLFWLTLQVQLCCATAEHTKELWLDPLSPTLPPLACLRSRNWGCRLWSPPLFFALTSNIFCNDNVVNNLIIFNSTLLWPFTVSGWAHKKRKNQCSHKMPLMALWWP